MKCTFTEGVGLILSMDINNLTDNQTVKQWVWYNVCWTQQTGNNKKKRKEMNPDDVITTISIRLGEDYKFITESLHYIL